MPEFAIAQGAPGAAIGVVEGPAHRARDVCHARSSPGGVVGQPDIVIDTVQACQSKLQETGVVFGCCEAINI